MRDRFPRIHPAEIALLGVLGALVGTLIVVVTTLARIS